MIIYLYLWNYKQEGGKNIDFATKILVLIVIKEFREVK